MSRRRSAQRPVSTMSKTPSSSSPLPPTLLFFFLITLPISVISQSINNQEQAILLRLKQQWNNPLTIQSWNPLKEPDHCKWVGVTCTEGSVTNLTLTNANIADKIPQSICDLGNLTVINFSYNLIPGAFPTVLYNCSKLQYLDLSQNYFIDPIPSDISRISTLQTLNLAANNFSGEVPASLGSLPELKQLYLHYNLFNGSFPPEISNLSKLEELGLANNPFIPWRFPKDFGKLKNLWFLWMVDTNLIGDIPVEIGNLSNLQWLDLSNNSLTGSIPGNIFLLKNLTNLYLQQNKLSGEIPRKIDTMYLFEIDLSMNQLSGTIPEDFGKLKNLIHFDMFANHLTGEVPASIGRIPSLIGTKLFKNNLSGILPPDFGLYSKLEEFQVSENQFSGSLPENLCAGGVLNGLIAFSNQLTGGLPKSLEKCDSLMYVQLHENRFSGEVPSGFWSLPYLSMVIIHDNMFTDELPEKLSSNLSRLEMHNNRFSGRIPSNIGASGNLTVFKASNNLFTGELPVELTALSRLQTLSLDGNRLSGQIPAKIISWVSLNTLNLSSNQLSGEIPSGIGMLPGLNVLDLSNNQLSGPIPQEIGRLRPTFLNFSSNQLTGKLPVGLENSVYDESFLNNTGLCTSKSDRERNSELRRSKGFPTRLLAMILALSGAVLFVFGMFAFLAVRDYRRRKPEDLSSYKLTSFQRVDFTESKILSNLTENNLIGSGGSGMVYRVDINHPSSKYVAVKKIWSKGRLEQKLEKEFLSEIEILGTIRHSNIVKLLCYISNGKSKLLVYEYMENRSLDRWLHGKRRGSLVSSAVHHTVLDWPKRMQIAVGAAQGLSYMHHNCSPAIIHRDVKSSNILLDSEFNAKIADFGLARMLAKIGESDTMSVVAGSFGYLAPEYAHTSRINEKIDVYSFGVVLLELCTGREAKEGDQHTSLAEWAWRHFQDSKTIESALDEDAKEPCHVEEMSTVFKLGLMCTSTLPSTRPSMKDVLQILLRNGSSHSHKEKIIQIENDAAPLLKTSKGSRKKQNSDNVDNCDSLVYSV